MFGIFKRTHNNFFITICRNNGEVIISKSAGTLPFPRRRARTRRNIISVEDLCDHVAALVHAKKIKKLNAFFIDSLFTRHSPKKITRLLLSSFKCYNLKIKVFFAYKIRAHNGVYHKKRKRR